MKQKPKLIYLGDDFTGSTDPLNVLGSRGVPCVLFIKDLDPEIIDTFEFISPHFKGRPLETFGLAGASRSLPAAKMDAYLAPRFAASQQFEPEFFHYKVCSTFDSSPKIGNIGTAIETGRKVFGDAPCPVLVASEHLKRYVIFSHLFAAYKGEVFAIDSHPVMSVHPVTPMPDSDLRVHLSKQTSASIGYVHAPDLGAAAPDGPCHDADLWANDIIVFDGLHDDHLRESIALVAQQVVSSTKFIVGSSGVEDGLFHFWQSQGSRYSRLEGRVEPAESLMVISGSCSLVTAGQITHALANGFEGIRIDPSQVLDDTEQVIGDIAEGAVAMLNEGRLPLIYSALGPNDPSIETVKASGRQHDLTKVQGRILSEILSRVVPHRVIVAGGDTSSYALDQLDVTALELYGPNAGSPLCMIRSPHTELEGLQILLQGGQVGEEQFYTRMLNGWEY